MLRNAHEITSTTSSLSLRERVGVRGYKMLKLFRARSLASSLIESKDNSKPFFVVEFLILFHIVSSNTSGSFKKAEIFC
jgi:hypothetical protein